MAGPCLNHKKNWMEVSWMEGPCVYYHRGKLDERAMFKLYR